jgi:DNA replication initiation complex subunit (GINS family)
MEANTPESAVNITYETLFDLLRVEKSRDEVQELSVTFYPDVISYLKKKHEILKRKEHESDIRDADSLRQLRIQIENVHKLIKSLFERREKKIVDMAMNKSRTNSGIITTQNLLPEEIVFYTRVLSLLDATRDGILRRLLNLQLPSLVFDDGSHEGTQEEKKSPVVKGNVLVRFLKPVPAFVGPSLEHHGPFLENDVANLPEKVARVLIEKERVSPLD